MRNTTFFLFFICVRFLAANDLGGAVWLSEKAFAKSEIPEGATVFFDKWEPSLKHVEKRSFKAAILLDKSMNPFNEEVEDLPSLKVLSAIDDTKLIEKYFTFFQQLSLTKGIDFIVLPDSSSLSANEKRIISYAASTFSGYFVPLNALKSEFPSSKREFKKLSEEKAPIWVLNEESEWAKILKWDLNKIEKTKGRNRPLNRKDIFPVFGMNDELAQLLFEQSAVLLANEKPFPLLADTVVYLGDDKYLKRRLNFYATVLSERTGRHEVINDIRFRIRPTAPGDIVIQWLDSEVVREQNTSLLVADVWHEEDFSLAQMIFGAKPVVGNSPHPMCRKAGSSAVLGLSNAKLERLDSKQLDLIDSIAEQAISKYATPGAQVAVIKNGQLVNLRSYGYFTYDSTRKVAGNTIYDLASLTKVIATLPALGILIDQGKISLDDSLGLHLPALIGSDKSGITIKEILAHQSGLPSYVPFWDMNLAGDRLSPFVYLSDLHQELDIRSHEISQKPFLKDTLQKVIARTALRKKKEYHYSDVGFMLLHFLIEEVSQQPLDEFLSINVFRPLGMDSTFFNPSLRGINFELIPPTEYDKRYRKYQVWAEVHDRNALLLGGVSGHAGLFSTAKDLAKMMVLFLNDGYYAGKQIIGKSTMQAFNQRYFEHNRRGLGWDKKDKQFRDSSSKYSDDTSFGHTGFTGTMFWADPANDLGFIFLSNRIFPDASNWRLGTLNTRTVIHDLVYSALENHVDIESAKTKVER